MIKALAEWRSTSAPSRSLGGATWAIVSFALSLIAMVWFSSGQRLDTERNNLQRDLMLKPANLALALDQYVQRTASELDRILLFLRTSYERSGGRVEWKDLIREDFTINEQSVQIAVIDKNGRMLTSTAMLSPTTPVGPQRSRALSLSRQHLGRSTVHRQAVDRASLGETLSTVRPASLRA